MSRRPANQASRTALRPLLNASRAALRANGSVETGQLLRAMTIKRDGQSPKLKPRYLVGPDSQSKAVRYAHLVEFGTAPHLEPKRKIMHPGARPRPFLRPAFEETKEAVARIWGEQIGPAIEKRAAALAKKGRL
jgi:HK97 gp10 family phage protein